MDSSSQPQFTDFPSYLTGNPNQNLQAFQNRLPSLYNFKNIAATGNAFIQSNFDQGRASAAAQAAAAQNRAMQSGGQVGASFAQSSAMLPIYNQRNQQSLDLAKMQGQMRESEAGLYGQSAGQMDQNSMQRAAQQNQYGLAQQQMSSQNAQFQDTFGLQQQQFGLQQRQFGLSALRQAPRAPVNYNFPGSWGEMGFQGGQGGMLPSQGNIPYQGSASQAQRYAALQY